MNETFRKLFTEVAGICGTRHMATTIKDAIIHATEQLHERKEYQRDIHIVKAIPELVDCGSYYTDEGSFQDIPRVRYIKSILVDGVAATKFDVLGLRSASFNTYRHAYAVYGKTFRIRTLDKACEYELVYLQSPDTTLNGYESWIADSPFRSAIVYRAASEVLLVLQDTVASSLWLQRSENALEGIGEY